MKFAGKLYSGYILIGSICANDFTTLKRIASRKCNDYANPIDKMVLHRVNDQENGELTFIRINRLSPNNTVVRGKWE